MITWIQTYFQKHFRTIFAILLGVIIVTFVFTFNATGGIGRGDDRSVEQRFFGYNLNSEKEGGQLVSDGARSIQLNAPFSRLDESSIQQYALSRIAALALADELGLPQPTDKEITAHIATIPAFQNQQGSFDQAKYVQFGDYVKNNPQFTVADANRLFRDDARIATVQKLIGGPGYVLPADVREFLGRTDAQYSVSVASLDYAAYDPKLSLTDDVLQKFFADNSAEFEVGPRLRTSAILFNAADFIPTGAIPEEQLRAYYNTNQARFPAPAEPAATGTTPPALPNPLAATGDNFEKVRPQVEAALRQEMGSRAANEAANQFTIALYGSKTKANSPELAAFLTSQKRMAFPVEPFNQDNPPATLPWLAYYSRQLNGLGQEKFFSDPLATPSGTIVLLWNETLAPHQPTFAEAKAKVTVAYQESEKIKRFFAEGTAVQAKLAAAVKAGGSFDQAATEAKLEVKSFANFTPTNIPKDFPADLRDQLEAYEQGVVSPMSRSRQGDKGYIIHVAKKTSPDLTPANPRFDETRKIIMGRIADSTSYAYLAQQVKAELDRTAPVSAEPKAPGAKP